MKSIDPSRVEVEYRDNVSESMPILDRRYTVTHSDDTGVLYVTIGETFAEDKIGPTRDEVLLSFYQQDDKLYIVGSVLLDSDNPNFDTERRNEIFVREMPIALQAVRYADRAFFESMPMLDQLPVYIWFESTQDEYNRLQDFGIMNDYVVAE